MALFTRSSILGVVMGRTSPPMSLQRLKMSSPEALADEKYKHSLVGNRIERDGHIRSYSPPDRLPFSPNNEITVKANLAHILKTYTKWRLKIYLRMFTNTKWLL